MVRGNWSLILAQRRAENKGCPRLERNHELQQICVQNFKGLMD